MPLCASVYTCFVVTRWERAVLLALICGVLLWVCHFPIGILGQVWYLIVLIPDRCTLTYFEKQVLVFFRVAVLHRFYCNTKIRLFFERVNNKDYFNSVNYYYWDNSMLWNTKHSKKMIVLKYQDTPSWALAHTEEQWNYIGAKCFRFYHILLSNLYSSINSKSITVYLLSISTFIRLCFDVMCLLGAPSSLILNFDLNSLLSYTPQKQSLFSILQIFRILCFNRCGLTMWEKKHKEMKYFCLFGKGQHHNSRLSVRCRIYSKGAFH